MAKRLLRWMGYALLALILVCLGLYLANKTLMDRYVRMAVSQAMGKSQQADWYEPVDPIPGNWAERLPAVAVGAQSVSETALLAARDYAGEMQSDAFLVWQGGALQHATYFGAFEQADLVASKSMAKMVAGIAVGRAIAMGYLDGIDVPMATYITEWQGTPKEAPTIRHFLWNSSGISRFEYNDFRPWSIAMREYLSTHHEEILLSETEYQYTPGTEYDYSMITSDMIAILIERATGMRYADFLSEALFKPLGAADGSVYINRPGGLAHSGCCLMLTAESLIRFGILLIQDGLWEGERLLPDGWVAETLKPSPAKPNWGLHMWIGQPYQERLKWFADPYQDVGVLQSEPYLAEDLFLFDGSGNQVMYMVPSLNLIVLRAGPRPRLEEGEWDNAVLINTVIRGMAGADS